MGRSIEAEVSMFRILVLSDDDDFSDVIRERFEGEAQVFVPHSEQQFERDSFWEVPVVVSTSAWTLAVEEESDRVEAIDIFEKDDEGIEDLVHVVSDYIV